MKTKIGIVESIDSIDSIESIEFIKKLEWDVLEEYLTELLEFTPYSNNTNHSDTLHCRCLGHEVNIESETIEIIDIEDFHNHFNERTEEYEWCGFQMTYNADIFFRTLATVAEIKRREILEKKFK
jgi:hypothetical protein